MYLNWDTFNLAYRYTKSRGPVVRIDLPLISSWWIDFHYAWNILNNRFIVRRNDATLWLKNLKVSVEGHIEINQEGYPIFSTQDIYADLGSTQLKLKNKKWLQTIATEFVKVLNMLTNHSLKLYPEGFIDRMMQRIFKFTFRDYAKTFQIEGVDKYGFYDLDMRMVKAPKVTRQFMDLYFYGQTTIHGFRESEIPDPAAHEFIFNNERLNDLQIIVTDRMVNTFLEATGFTGAFQKSTFDKTFWQFIG